jgi:hypothetical protein
LTGGTGQPTASPSTAPGPSVDWVLLDGRDCWAFRTFRYVGGVVAWSGTCQNNLATGAGMLSWWSGKNAAGQLDGRLMTAMVFGDFSQGRLEGEAPGHAGIMQFRGIFHSGVMVSTVPPYGPIPSGIAFAAPSTSPRFDKVEEFGAPAGNSPGTDYPARPSPMDTNDAAPNP